MTRMLAAAALCLIAVAASSRGGEVYVGHDHFEWEEFDSDGKQLLKEDGPLFTVGLAGERPLGATWKLAGKVEGFLGEVDYDGQTQVGAPVRTTTEYYGLRTEADARRPFAAAESLRLAPLAGLGARGWLRRLDNAGRDSGGYDEWWLTVYAQGGLRAEWDTRGGTYFAEAALQAPLYNGNRLSLEIDGSEIDTTLEPGRELTLSAEIGLRFGDAFVALTFEQIAFGESDVEDAGPYAILQPESEGYVMGVRVGIAL